MKATRHDITPAQIKVIWSIWKARVGMPAAELYALVEHVYGAERLHDLSYDDAQTLIRDLRTKTGQEDPPANRLTRWQRLQIERRAARLRISEGGLRVLCRRVTKREHWRWLDELEARSLIAALEHLERHNLIKAIIAAEQARGRALRHRDLKHLKMRELREHLEGLGGNANLA